MPRGHKALLLPVFLLLAGFFCYVSQQHFIDGDEGFYLLAARLVLQHKIPYLDFFFTQAPLLPYVYALWLKVAGVSWASARILCALLTTLLGGLIYEHVCHETGKWLAGIAAVLLFASSSLVFVWFPIVKTFALATLFLFLAYVILSRLTAASPAWQVALAGVAFGLSVDTRSYVVAVAPVFFAWILWQARGRRAHRLLWFLGGFILGIAPSLALFFASPDAYLFNNLGYHQLRSSSGLIGNWKNKAEVVRLLLTGNHTGFQFTVLSAICAGMFWLRRTRRPTSLFAFLLAALLGLISLLPTPAALQYFAMVMPFLIVAAVGVVSDGLAGAASPLKVRLAAVACLALLGGYVASAVPIFQEYLYTGREVLGAGGPANASNWTLQQVTAVSLAIDQFASPGEKVASFWSGYIFASWADPYPGFENNFGSFVARELPEERRRKYRIVSDPEINLMFARHAPRLAVIGNQGLWSGGLDSVLCTQMLQTYGYRPTRTVGHTVIYECCATRDLSSLRK
jgi:4-amino-4-deoxy-L-arabinose transferase-like glycosyltransferase